MAVSRLAWVPLPICYVNAASGCQWQ